MLAFLPTLTLLLMTASCSAQQVPGESFHSIRYGDKEGYEWTEDFFPGSHYAAKITCAEEVLGQALGSRLAHHDEILTMFRLWDEQSDRLTLHEYGRTYEGRPLVYAVITSAANHGQLEQLRAGNSQLSDPRGLSLQDGQELVQNLPAVAWMGYSIHGDETSGADAAMAVAYQLIASEDKEMEELLSKLIIVLDPCMNPDGRMRIVPMTEQMAGFRTSLDPSSMSRGHWPYGRGNHYLFDMNRDWMAGIAPETRGRWAVNQLWRPQLFVDAHEQGGSDTFLMYPQAKPRHPELPAELLKWQGVFADDHGAAFDGYGWGYYTREWADAWYPGYSDAWGSLNGAIGMLYEQGRYAGQPYERPSGEIVPYRRAVHAQALASMSNLKTLAANRVAILQDYLTHRRSQVAATAPGAQRAYLLTAAPNDSRTQQFLNTLLAQGIEIWQTNKPFAATHAVHTLGVRLEQREFPAGTLVIPAQQPQGALVRAYLDFDPRMSEALLTEERASLERDEGSKLYDITAWDLTRAYALDAWWADVEPLSFDYVMPLSAAAGVAVKPFQELAFAWAVDAADDRVLVFAARAMERGLKLHISDEDFTGRAEQQTYAFTRGSVLLRRHENQGIDLDSIVQEVAEETGVRALALSTGRSPDLEKADLGGQHFTLLRQPHVALLAGPSVGTSSFGHIWQYLDEELGIPVTLLNLDGLGYADLREYNVILAPPGASLGEAQRSLTSWVRNGGTLIALGSAASSIADSDLSSVKLRRNALEELKDFAFAVAQQRAAGGAIDFVELWGDPAFSTPPTTAETTTTKESTDAANDAAEAQASTKSADEAAVDSDAERHESWLQRFSPQGSILRVELNQKSFLTVGRGLEIPVHTEGRLVYLAADQVAGRYVEASRLRLGGLLWPEARERLADSVWLMREGRGRGQVILFAQHPNFRGAWRGSARLLGNAVVLGPGAGADPPPGR
jgi:hypothetical protein